MIPVINIILITIFVIWISLTLLRQLLNKNTPISEKLGGHGFSFITPVFTLFAPRPVNSDFHILYRKYAPEKSGLIEVMFNEERKWYTAFWNPNLKPQKVVITSLRSVSTLFQKLKENKDLEFKEKTSILFRSKSYLSLKKLVCQQIEKSDFTIKEGDVVEISIFRSQFSEDKLITKPFIKNKFIYKVRQWN